MHYLRLPQCSRRPRKNWRTADSWERKVHQGEHQPLVCSRRMLSWSIMPPSGLGRLHWAPHVHHSIKTIPLFLTHGMEAHQSGFRGCQHQEQVWRTPIPWPTSPETPASSRHTNEQATFRAQKGYNRTAEPSSFVWDQLVLLEDSYVTGRNAKLSPRFTGPNQILDLELICLMSSKC